MTMAGVNDIKPKGEPEYPEALAAMLAEMKKPTFTFASVYGEGDRTLPRGSKATCYRWADRLLQKARRAGSIELLPGRRGWRSTQDEGTE